MRLLRLPVSAERRWPSVAGRGLLLCLLLLLVSACGSTSGGSGGAASTPGVSADTITIGGVLDTTGPIKVICAPIATGRQSLQP
ncbi:hypothetical protein [Thermogemmatispora sp.]|uniref:hypothetical protein n=1 Tax=Thermogemmatispora sp. TaxID=1968838 RepID=UPI0035E3F584